MFVEVLIPFQPFRHFCLITWPLYSDHTTSGGGVLGTASAQLFSDTWLEFCLSRVKSVLRTGESSMTKVYFSVTSLCPRQWDNYALIIVYGDTTLEEVLAPSRLTLNVPIVTKVVCFSRLLKCLRDLYGKQCGPRSDCSYMISLFWVRAVCFYTLIVSMARQLFAADDFSRRHFQMHFFPWRFNG